MSSSTLYHDNFTLYHDNQPILSSPTQIKLFIPYVITPPSRRHYRITNMQLFVSVSEFLKIIKTVETFDNPILGTFCLETKELDFQKINSYWVIEEICFSQPS